MSDRDLAKDLSAVADSWEVLARSDPLWAVLSEQSKRGRRWSIDEFLQTGVREIERFLLRVQEGQATLKIGFALDFGCGVGRLSRALAVHFDKVVGVDISETMLKIAAGLNVDRSNLSFLLNRYEDLRGFRDGEADLVFSHITLQHLSPALAESYIDEFFRVTRSGGLIYFQLPSHLLAVTDEPKKVFGELGVASPKACLSEIAICSAPSELAVGECAHVIVRVQNISDGSWKHQFNLGNHWLTVDGEVMINDDGRAEIPFLEAGAATILALEVVAPSTPGEYCLELDLVQEGVRWFVQAGSRTTSILVHVVATDAANGPSIVPAAILNNIDPVYKTAPAFEMHGVHRERVMQLANKWGAKLVYCTTFTTDWVSHEYIFEKSPRPTSPNTGLLSAHHKTNRVGLPLKGDPS
jgi:SAM-dependent methyltransferase